MQEAVGSPGHRGEARWTRRAILFLSCAALVTTASGLAAVLAVVELHHIYFDRHNLPDLGPFTRFELPTIGRIYDASGSPLIELAREYREVVRYEDIPPIVRDAILAAEDKRFFSHNGIDYLSVPRVFGKIRGGMLAGRLVRRGRHDDDFLQLLASFVDARDVRKGHLPLRAGRQPGLALAERERRVSTLATMA